jgi:hypothetical protein
MENSSSSATTATTLDQHADRVRASGLLGRSDLIRRLFDYLVACAGEGRVPKEIEVAIDGFGRPADFDVSQDAMVRVYVHKLRRKLEEYYAQPGAAADGSLRIPRGEYRLVLDAASEPVVVEPDLAEDLPVVVPPVARPTFSVRERWGAGLLVALLVACTLLVLDRLDQPRIDPDTRALRGNALWAPLLADDLPIQIVLGDYYIFGEREGETVERLVRDFDINSRTDLEHRQMEDAEFARRSLDLNLGYLPTSSAQALRAVLPILTGSGKRVTISLASELPPSAFKTTHVVYIGYLSGMGMMQDVVFAGSRFAIGGSYDELIDTENGTPYVSEAGGPLTDTERYRDYAYLSTFGGPDGNQHVILAGTRDTAVMQTAEIASSVRRSEELLARNRNNKAFEALYEVYGVSRTNLESRLLLTRALDVDSIWGEGPADLDSVAHVTADGARR